MLLWSNVFYDPSCILPTIQLYQRESSSSSNTVNKKKNQSKNVQPGQGAETTWREYAETQSVREERRAEGDQVIFGEHYRIYVITLFERDWGGAPDKQVDMGNRTFYYV